MGNICSICYPCGNVKNRQRGTARKFSEIPKVPSLEGQEESLLFQAQLESNDDSAVQVVSLPTFTACKSESIGQLLAGNMAAVNGGTRTNAEKKSLASKLSGTLNRNNSESRNFSESKINALFEKYKDESEDAILSEGMEQLCLDLQLKPDEFKVLVLAWKLEAEEMCRFTRQEFLTGCRAMKVDSLKGIQTRLPELVTQTMADPDLFRDLYRFTFKFGLDVSTGQRILPVDMAVNLWLLVFSQQEPPLLKRWIYFLEKHPQVRGIPRDTWHMFLNFVRSVGPDLSRYDDTEAWPSLIDDFVEFENDQLNQNSSAMLDLNRENSATPST